MSFAPLLWPRFAGRSALGVFAGLLLAASSASAADQIYFPAVDNVTNVLVAKINAETVRIDMSAWYLTEHSISIALLNRFKAGVPVRLIGDRGSIFEIDPLTKKEFYWLASQGVPIRLRYNPTWFPEIDHWKCTIFVGQNAVAFGSSNYTPFELAPTSSTNYKDETVLVTDDSLLVGAFKTKFDRFWNDTVVEPNSIIAGPPYFKNWNDACATEAACSDYASQYPTPAPMNINTARLEADNPMPPDMVWSQGPEFNNRLIQEINNEPNGVDFVIYRLTVGNITDALLSKFKSGVPVRLIVEPNEYLNRKWPEFWLTHAYIDKLYAAGVAVKQRRHDGLTHMKMLVTSAYATNASSNYAANWQRDHDYFVPAATKPAIYQAMANRFNTMWNDAVGFTNFVPQPPDAATLASPSNGTGGYATNGTLTWNTAPFATSYDIYLGPSQANLSLVANVPAQLVENPPTTYSWTPPTPLSGGATYSWQVVSRTNATPVNSSLVAYSPVWSFSTGGTASQTPGIPSGASPATGATGVSVNPMLFWSSTNATSYTVNFGASNPPPQAASGLTSASYSPGALSSGTIYYWQVIASNGAGSTTGAVWSFTTTTASPAPLPSPWRNQDVGAVGVSGSTSYSSGQFMVSGAGADIWGTADAFQYAYQPFSGDGVLVARLTSIANTGPYAKAGVMFRESLGAGAAHVILDVRPGGSIEFMTRSATGAQTTYLAGGTQPIPAWLKLARSGSTFTAWVSADGSTWSSIGSTSVAMAGSAFVGLIVNSHNTGALNTSTFDNVSVSAVSVSNPPSAPTAPNPASGATGVGVNPTLTWSAAGAASYDIAFGTSNPPPAVANNLQTASYSPGVLQAGTTYYWRVTAWNLAGSAVGPVWSFTTAAAGGGIPSPWQNQDVGSVGVTGSAAYSSGQFSVSGAGADIWGSADAFQFVYQPLSGDGQIVTRVASVQNTDTYAKAGIMLRSGLSAGASHVVLDVRPGGSIEFMTRSTSGGATTYLAGATQALPAWLRLVRSGSTVTASVSPNGSTWTTVGSTSITLPSTAYAGMVVTSHTTSALNTSVFDNVSVSATAPGSAPAAPTSPNPADGSTGVATNATLSWSSSAGASTYDVAFGVSNPPPTAASGISSASYSPGSLTAGTTYYWRVTARNSVGNTAGPVWSFTTGTAVTTNPDVVIYASDIASGSLHGSWSSAADASSPNGVKLVTPDAGWSAANAPLASPSDYVDVTFNANAGTAYTIWLRLKALGNSKYNDAVWVQFSDALSNGSPIYGIGSGSGLLVNLATDGTGSSLSNWGWQNGAYWLSQAVTVSFANSGQHTLRIQVREDGVQFDQIVLSSTNYRNSAPGAVSNDSTIVPK